MGGRELGTVRQKAIGQLSVVPGAAWLSGLITGSPPGLAVGCPGSSADPMTRTVAEPSFCGLNEEWESWVPVGLP